MTFPAPGSSRSRAAELIEEHWSGAANRYHEVSCLATLSLVYRHFIAYGLRAPGEAALRSAA